MLESIAPEFIVGLMAIVCAVICHRLGLYCCGRCVQRYGLLQVTKSTGPPFHPAAAAVPAGVFHIGSNSHPLSAGVVGLLEQLPSPLPPSLPP